ncbi:hypothetical protein FQN60_015718, partial [Etheostoma spectabile]
MTSWLSHKAKITAEGTLAIQVGTGYNRLTCTAISLLGAIVAILRWFKAGSMLRPWDSVTDTEHTEHEPAPQGTSQLLGPWLGFRTSDSGAATRTCPCLFRTVDKHRHTPEAAGRHQAGSDQDQK